MFKSLFGGRKKRGKSVVQERGRAASKPPESNEDAQARRIKALKAKNLRKAEIKAAVDHAGPFQRPDVEGLVTEARSAHEQKSPAEAREMVHRALKLKGAAGIVDETLAHPARRYIALAIMRGLLEEGESAREPLDPAPKSPEKSEKPPK